MTVETVVGSILQALVTLAAVWLALETRGLRLSSNTQIQLLRAQRTREIAPYLVSKFQLPTVENEAKQRYSVFVKNLTNSIAFRVDLWMFDPKQKNYVDMIGIEEYLEAKSDVTLAIRPTATTRTKMIEAIGRNHPLVEIDDYLAALDDKEGGYAILFYDEARQPYVLSRGLRYDSTKNAVSFLTTENLRPLKVRTAARVVRAAAATRGKST